MIILFSCSGQVNSQNSKINKTKSHDNKVDSLITANFKILNNYVEQRDSKKNIFDVTPRLSYDNYNFIRAMNVFFNIEVRKISYADHILVISEDIRSWEKTVKKNSILLPLMSIKV